MTSLSAPLVVTTPSHPDDVTPTCTSDPEGTFPTTDSDVDHNDEEDQPCFIKNITKEKVINLLNGFLNEDQTEKEANHAYLDYSIKEARESFEKSYLTYNLKKYNNNISQESQKIGMERTALYRKLKLLKIYASN